MPVVTSADWYHVAKYYSSHLGIYSMLIKPYGYWPNAMAKLVGALEGGSKGY